MAIRFDKDAKRATNGPLIFFSDASSQEAFAEEIRGAIISGLSFYSYRSPSSTMVSFGSSEGFIEGIGEPGFVIGLFDPEKPFITIPYRGVKHQHSSLSLYTMPQHSTSYEDYSKEVEGIISDLKNVKRGKVVAARVILRNEPLPLAETFYEFCRKFPEAFIFCFSTPATGCWIGATPELLLESSGTYLNSMALAGTRNAGSNRRWDEKNMEEQRIVTDYILNVLKANGLKPFTEETVTKQTGNIEHICTPIFADSKSLNAENLYSLLKSLSPTPALCGSPKNFALTEIQNFEKFQRGCYGGFCGPYRSLQDFSLNVVLRCAAVDQLKYCIYSGGGITSVSTVEEEWKETEMKANNTFGF